MNVDREVSELGKRPCQAPPALWPYLLSCALAAVWIDFGTLHQSQHADSLLSALISLQAWTPFYWELDRIGMLGPLLTIPIRHPLANLLVQDALYVFGALAALVLLARYMLRDASYTIVGTLSVTALVAWTPAYYRFEYLVNTQYGVWLLLGLSGLLLLEPRADGSIPRAKAAAALVVLILAHWVYCTASLFLGPLVLFRYLLQWRQSDRKHLAESQRAGVRDRLMPSAARRGRHTESLLSLLWLGVAFAVGMVLMRLSPYHGTDFGTLPWREWPGTCQRLAANTWDNLSQPWLWFLLLAGGLGALAMLSPPYRRCGAPGWRPALALALAAGTIGLFMGTRRWVAMNQYMFRFLMPSALLMQTALLTLAAAPWRMVGAETIFRRWHLVGAPAMLLACAYSYGWPSLSGVRRDLDSHHRPTKVAIVPLEGLRPDEILASGCTHVAGDYWTVWPAVFSANLAIYEREERRNVWGITFRSEPTRHFWAGRNPAEMRIAVAAAEDPSVAEYIDRFGLGPLTVVEERATLRVMQPARAVSTGATEEPGPEVASKVRRPITSPRSPGETSHEF